MTPKAILYSEYLLQNVANPFALQFLVNWLLYKTRQHDFTDHVASVNVDKQNEFGLVTAY